MTESSEDLGVNQEGSTARTEARAAVPLLDVETESLITALEDAAIFDFGRDGFLSDARNALRLRIRDLVEQRTFAAFVFPK